MLKVIVSGPAVALASTIAWRKVPVPAFGAGFTPPLSPVLVTAKVTACDVVAKAAQKIVGRRL